MPEDPYAQYQQPAQADPYAAYQQPSASYGTPPPVGGPGNGLSKDEAQKLTRPLPAGYEEQKPQGSALSRGLSGALEGVKNVVGGALSMTPPALAYSQVKSELTGQNPIVDTAKAQGKKAVEYAKKGRYAEAGGAALGAIPGGGFIEKIAERAGGKSQMPDSQQTDSDAADASKVVRPDVAGAVGESVPTLAAMSPNNVVIPAVRGAARAGRAVAGVFEADPSIALVKALRPTPSDAGFTDRLPDAIGNIKAASPRPIRSNADLIDATQVAIEHHQNALEAWMQSKRKINASAPGDAIVNATANAIPDSMRMENPDAAQGLVDQMQQAYGGKRLGVDQLRTLLKEKNAELDSFFDRAEGKQRAAVTSGTPQAVVKAQRDAIANTLYELLDPQNKGAGPRLIQKQTGDMIDIRDAALRRKNAIIGEKPVSTAGGYGRAAARVADLPGKVFHGDIEGGIEAIPAAIRGTSDPLIARAFGAVKGKPAPLPTPQGVQPRALLGPGATRMPGVANPSGPTGAPPPPRNPGYWTPRPRQQQLNAPPIQTPPPADTSGPTGAPPYPGRGMSQNTGSRSLPPPSQVPQGGFSVEHDLAPVKNPTTGQIEYTPKWTQQNPVKVGDTMMYQGRPVRVTKIHPDGTADIE